MTDQTPKIKTLREFYDNFGDQAPPDMPRLLSQFGSPDTQNFWKWREEYRFITNAYKQPLWTTKLTLTKETTNHFAHVSRRDPLFIAFTPNDKYGQNDRHNQIKPGKYLAQFYSHILNDKQIQDYANQHQINFGPPQLIMANTPDEIEEVYRKGPGSCMGGKDKESAFDHLGAHPTRVYSGPDTCVAYSIKSGKIIARTVINKIKNQYTRIYGEPGLIVPLLKKEGYTEGTLTGCRLPTLAVKNYPNHILMPYIDYVKRLDYDPKEPGKFVIISSSGPLSGETTNGLIPFTPPCTCHECKKNTVSYETINGNKICGNCLSKNYVYAYRTNSEQVYIPKTTAGIIYSADKTIAFENETTALALNYILSTHTGKWHHKSHCQTLEDSSIIPTEMLIHIRNYTTNKLGTYEYIINTDPRIAQSHVRTGDGEAIIYINYTKKKPALPTFDDFCAQTATRIYNTHGMLTEGQINTWIHSNVHNNRHNIPPQMNPTIRLKMETLRRETMAAQTNPTIPIRTITINAAPL